MTSLNVRQSGRSARPWLVLLASVAFGLAACSGDHGKSGPSGPPGPDGPPGPSPEGGLPVASAKIIKASIVGVTVPDDGKPVLEVRLANESGSPLSGLPAGNIRFVLARLEPGNNGKSSTWHAVTRTTEAFPCAPVPPATTCAPTPADRVTGTGPRNQATAEKGTAGTWTESSGKNGVYTYKFAQSLNGISDIPYDPNLVHRVGLEIRTSPNLTPTNIPANNAVFTWLPATGNALAQSGREIVDNDTCNACHDNLAVHGDARFDLQYCAMCHESYSFDAQSGNTIDLKVMIHKIHSGETLPSVEAGGFYGIFGYGNTFTDFGEIVYPQDKRNCQTCHQESDTDTPQASNYRITVNTEACGACHDNVNWTTGANHGGVAATDEQCETCHGPNSTIEGGNLRPQVAHLVPSNEAAKKFKYTVVSVTNTAPGQFPIVTVKVTDPTNGDAPYDITSADPANPYRQPRSRLRVDLAWATADFNNNGLVWTSVPGQPFQVTFANGAALQAGVTRNADGSFTQTSTTAIPAATATNPGATGSGLATLEGRPMVDNNGDGDALDAEDEVPVDSVSLGFKITDTTLAARRSIVDIKKCNDCHKPLALHGDNRVNNTDLCASCHNPAATAGFGTADEGPIDLKHMVHALHNGTWAAFPQFNLGSGYPGHLNNCEGCHKVVNGVGTYFPVDPLKVQATSVNGGTDRNTFADDTAVSPTASACSGCHVADVKGVVAGTTVDAAAEHMKQNGGSFNLGKTASGASTAGPGLTTAPPIETCQTCHGAGRAADVKVVHKVGEFQYN